jgi:hypothetical protein
VELVSGEMNYEFGKKFINNMLIKEEKEKSMKPYTPLVPLILSVMVILGCSICGITTPVSQPTSTPAPTSAPAIQPQPSVDQIQIIFMADRTNVNSGECALLQWAVQGPAQIIQLDSTPVPPTGQKQVCPQTTTTYTLMAGLGTSQQSKQSQLVINVTAANEVPTETLVPTPTKTLPPPAATATKTKKPTPTVTETSAPPPQGGGSWGPTGTDIELLKVGVTSTTGAGNIYLDIRNNGPKEFSGIIEYICQGSSYIRSQPNTIIPVAMTEKVPNTIGIGTGFFNTKLFVNLDTYSYPVITCTIVVPDDPEPGNNTGAISIP